MIFYPRLFGGMLNEDNEDHINIACSLRALLLVYSV
jgi:hypothetical protein